MFLLDTNVLSELIRARPQVSVVRKMLSYEQRLLFASEMTRYELRFGAAIHAKGKAIWTSIATHILPLPTWLSIDSDVTMATADLSARMRQARRTMQAADAFIAATALVHDLILVTRNARHFESVPELEVENWFPAD